MANRNARFLDVRNYLYEVNQAWLRASEEVNKHFAENGKDSTYYILLGRQDGIHDMLRMAETLVSGQYQIGV